MCVCGAYFGLCFFMAVTVGLSAFFQVQINAAFVLEEKLR